MAKSRTAIYLLALAVVLLVFGHLTSGSKAPDTQATTHAPTVDASVATDKAGVQADTEVGPGDKVFQYEKQFPNHSISQEEFDWMGREAQRQIDCDMICPLQEPPSDVLAKMRCGLHCNEVTDGERPESGKAGTVPSAGSYYITGLDLHGDNWLALRSEPSGTTGERVAKLGPNEILKRLEENGDWTKVSTSTGQVGWVFSRYIACCKTEAAN